MTRSFACSLEGLDCLVLVIITLRIEACSNAGGSTDGCKITGIFLLVDAGENACRGSSRSRQRDAGDKAEHNEREKSEIMHVESTIENSVMSVKSSFKD